MIIVRVIFPGWHISNCGYNLWISCPDLTPLDFITGYLRADIYIHRPTTLFLLKIFIRQVINRILVDMLERVEGVFRNRLHQFIDIGGSHPTDVLFKTARFKISYFLSLHKSFFFFRFSFYSV